MKTKFVVLIRATFIAATLAICTSAYSFDNDTVHQEINEKAGRQSIINDYFQNNLGYQEGIEKILNDKTRFALAPRRRQR